MTPPAEYRRAAFSISTDPGRLDIAAIHEFLTQSYWSPGVPLDVVKRAIQGSLCFGLYEGIRQIGFARVITDQATYAYVADVYVLESHRGQGLGVWLMETIMAYPALQGLRRMGLVTRDAHRLYEKLGFTPLAHPERHMEIARPDIYRC
ncbi:MAG TPA: GNAT family N-acetyltransferase [Gemmatimonadales bacterium]